MHPTTYATLADDRIADLLRDADRRRLIREARAASRATIHHRPPEVAPAPSRSSSPQPG